MKNQLKCYIYTRVSTSMQVDGYSLDAGKKLCAINKIENTEMIRPVIDKLLNGHF